MIDLLTDFGADDIYVRHVKAALLGHLPAGAIIIDLLHSVPNFHVRAGAHLPAALQSRFPADTVFLSVVDPGVGADRDALILQADNKWYVGPDNGLLSVVASMRRTKSASAGHRGD
jgi:S-adenosylmethionine hydrolase